MGVALHQAKSELFRSLGHPVRIRVLELLDDGPQTVRRLLDAIPIDASRLSQQLAVLRGTGLVVARHEGNTVEYSLGTDEVTDLLRTRHVTVQNGPSFRRGKAAGTGHGLI